LINSTFGSRVATQRATELFPEPIPPTIPTTGICVWSGTNQAAID